MAKRSRKRKLEGEDEAGEKWELTNILSEQLREEMASMWEIPQIYHFLHISKEALNTPHLSMYEMERMLAMPRASKQLANIMTCLLSPSLPKGKTRKVPSMPYEFWVNVLTHKVKGWFKVYHSKHQDIVKVLEAVGIEPEFWRVFPDSSVIDEKDFEQLTFKQRVWILKTLCDTLMHSRKAVQEISKQFTEDQFETILGADRYGAKYFYFPLFLDSDLRVYRHCIDNTILSTVKPPPWREGQPSAPKPDKHTRNKRKRSRWKNGALPKDRRRPKKSLEEEVKLSVDSAIGSLTSEDTNMSSISACSNNNNTAMEAVDRICSRSSSRTPERSAVLRDVQGCNPKSSGYDTNSSDAKSMNGCETNEMFRGFEQDVDNDNSADVICTIQDILDGITLKVSQLVKSDCFSLEIKREVGDIVVEKEEEVENDEDDDTSRVDHERLFDSDRETSRTDSPTDDANWTSYSPRKSRILDKEALQREITIFSGLLSELSVSNFELVADSVDSVKDLAASLRLNEIYDTRHRSSYTPKCELALASCLEKLAESLKDVEPALKESTRKARAKLQREWTQFKDGVVEDQDASGDADHGSNRWIIGSQGYPLLSSSDATLQTLSEPALSEPGPETPEQRPSSVESELRDADDCTAIKPAAESTEDGSLSEKCESQQKADDEDEHRGDGEGDDTEESKLESESRRVLRRRGISSYTEQLSSSEEEAYELEEWSRLAALYAAPGPSDGAPVVHAPRKAGQTGDEPEAKDSDQDWLLPGSRKRKNKRLPGNRKLKTSPQKSQANNSDSQDSTSCNIPSGDPRTQDPTKPSKPAKDLKNADVPPICVVDSVHSELDIKDEGPIYEYNRTPLNPANLEPSYPPAPQYQAAPPQYPPRPRGALPLQISHIESGYHIQAPERYYAPNAVPRFIHNAFPPPGHEMPRYPYPPGPLPRYPPPHEQTYWQYQEYGQIPPRHFPSNALRPDYAPQRNPAPLPRLQQVSSTTLYGARVPSHPPVPRMPSSRPVVVQNVNFRPTLRPRLTNTQPPRRYAPRNSPAQPPRMQRPSRPSQDTSVPVSVATKTTSLILLSDSDDEIEMIVPEKQSAANVAPMPNRHPSAAKKSKPPVPPPGQRPRPKPVVTSEITVPKSSEVLSPLMIQRMSQGGISITPVMPPPAKQPPSDNSQGTKLVVVVNETGSHYALALPNGSKLILTPEQVAQIRASNGGKLVL